MPLQVRTTGVGPELHDDGVGVVCQDLDAVNRFLGHLTVRAYSPATVRAYAFDLLDFLRFCLCRGLTLDRVSPGDLFGYLDWQAGQVRAAAPWWCGWPIGGAPRRAR